MVRGVRGTWCGALLLAGVLVGGASACGEAAPPPPGTTPSGVSGPAVPSATTAPGTTTEPSATTAPGTTTNPGTPTSPGTTTAPGTTPTADPRPGEVLVEVVVSGGLAGVRNQLVVHYDGSWTSRSGTEPPRTGRQTPAEAAELRAALEDPAFARVPERPTGSPIADGFQYRVTYRGRVVVAGDGERPPALQRVFAALPEGGPPTNP
ncbi:hypothetical protein [Streptomyces sp. NBC_00572]|uniref:hypothetical protein n=1 Tax=Streptomyces sp. NBC_00572 TaxID=2903664 RepID=UPI00225629AB|nr:hypothetical protein [Streptomyces sp. NBC_00572]MCX4983434.1 hypothetical protein [Streptomyces sp. NBC_00572]